MDALDKITAILEEVENVQSRLDEGASPRDKRVLSSVVHNPKNQKVSIMGKEVDVRTNGKKITFKFKENDEIVFVLIDIADANGLTFLNKPTAGMENFTINHLFVRTRQTCL